MRVFIYKDNISTGRGADFAVRNLATMLADGGAEVTFGTCQPKTLPFSCAFDPRVRLVFTAPGRLVADIARLNPDAVVSTGTNEIVDLDAGLRVAGAVRFPWPVVQQFHIYPPTMFKWRHPFRNLAIRRALQKAAAIQVLMPSFIEPTRRAAGLGADAKIVAIGNACGGLRPQAPEGTAREKLIVYPAALNPGKRQDLLVRAFAQVAAAFPDWTVELYGNGPQAYEGLLKGLIAKHGLDGRARLMGFTRELDRVYARAAFVAFPSAMEGFPMTVLDANEAGLPLVGCRRTPAVNELIADGKTGLLADETPAAYGAALARLMEDAELRRTLGQNARTAIARYSRENITRQWLEVLHGVVA